VLKQGSVIRATVYDPQGRNPKARPLVVTTPTHEISNREPLATVAITGEFDPDNLESDEIPLPFHPGGLAKSGLKKPSVAKCGWQELVEHSAVLEVRGHLASKHMTLILEKIDQLSAPPEP
jgi:hypothetical protein